MVKLPQKLNLDQLLTKWASIINPVITNPICNGIQLTDVTLSVGTNTINHKLGRKPNGYIITGMHKVYSQIYDSPSTMPTLNLILNSSAATSVDLYVY